MWYERLLPQALVKNVTLPPWPSPHNLATPRQSPLDFHTMSLNISQILKQTLSLLFSPHLVDHPTVDQNALVTKHKCCLPQDNTKPYPHTVLPLSPLDMAFLKATWSSASPLRFHRPTLATRNTVQGRNFSSNSLSSDSSVSIWVFPALVSYATLLRHHHLASPVRNMLAT